MRTRVAIAVSVLVVSLVGAGALFAAIAQPRLTPTAVDFTSLVDAESYTLTVATPGGSVWRRSFAAGEAISFSVAGFGDGDYQWELTAAPRLKPEERARLAAARTSGDPTAFAEAQRAAGISPDGFVQSGGFRVADGAIVDDAKQESPGGMRSIASPLTNVTAADQVIPDDLIVQGSTCVGLDCVNNETFDFDTLRLKENNTRVQFNDTSSSAGFPTNNWQIRANDSASGGASYLGFVDQGTNGTSQSGTINFRVTAGAPSNSLFVDSIGRIGLRTSTPVLDLHINTSNTPAIRLEQNNTGGFTAQTWDVAGNEANFFVRDVTNGSRLPFRVRPGAPTSSLDISADGFVGIGTASPDQPLNVENDRPGNALARFTNLDPTGFSGFEFFDDANVQGLFFGLDNTANNVRFNTLSPNPLVFFMNGTERVRFEQDGDVGIGCNAPGSDLVIASGGGCANPSSSINAGGVQFISASSRTFKENLSPVEVPDILEKIAAIDVYHYDFIAGPKDKIGLMAEDFHAVFERGDDHYIDGGDVQLALWLAVKRLTAVNEELTARLAALEAKLQATADAK